MGAGPLAGGPAPLVDAQVALGRLDDGLIGLFIDEGIAVRVPDLHQADGVVGTVAGAGTAADAGHVVDRYDPLLQVPVDGPGRTVDHADRILAVHAGVGDHVMPVRR